MSWLRGEIFKVAPNTRLCTEGDRAEHLFVVLRGRVKYSRLTAKGDELILRLFTPGETFGLATLMPNPLNYLGTAEAHFGGRNRCCNLILVSRRPLRVASQEP
jgi:CRP-like cAMP-binding protein